MPDQPIWMALAAPLPEPWTDSEAAYVDMRARLVDDELSHMGFETGAGPLRYHLPGNTQVQSFRTYTVLSQGALACANAVDFTWMRSVARPSQQKAIRNAVQSINAMYIDQLCRTVQHWNACV